MSIRHIFGILSTASLCIISSLHATEQLPSFDINNNRNHRLLVHCAFVHGLIEKKQATALNPEALNLPDDTSFPKELIFTEEKDGLTNSVIRPQPLLSLLGLLINAKELQNHNTKPNSSSHDVWLGNIFERPLRHLCSSIYLTGRKNPNTAEKDSTCTKVFENLLKKTQKTSEFRSAFWGMVNSIYAEEKIFSEQVSFLDQFKDFIKNQEANVRAHLLVSACSALNHEILAPANMINPQLLCLFSKQSLLPSVNTNQMNAIYSSYCTLAHTVKPATKYRNTRAFLESMQYLIGFHQITADNKAGQLLLKNAKNSLPTTNDFERLKQLLKKRAPLSITNETNEDKLRQELKKLSDNLKGLVKPESELKQSANTPYIDLMRNHPDVFETCCSLVPFFARKYPTFKKNLRDLFPENLLPFLTEPEQETLRIKTAETAKERIKDNYWENMSAPEKPEEPEGKLIGTNDLNKQVIENHYKKPEQEQELDKKRV